ncbi:hypothetical protein HOC35_04230 [Candidatus Woesearchaeota archaeon]|jgi:hypothetical protein|nr:hypothetical protein [Candidatus Woesearchaeota archaeon]
MVKHKHSMYLVVLVTLMILFGLVVMFDGCTKLVTDESGDDAEILTDEEFALEEDIPFDNDEAAGDLSGQAFTVGKCHDEDADSTKDPKQLLIKGKITYKGKSRLDKCYTFSSGKTYLFEYFCRNNGKVGRWQKNCAELNINNPGADYRCLNDACVNMGSDEVQEYPYCDSNDLYKAQGGGKSNCAAQKNPYNGLSRSCVGEPGEANCKVACDEDYNQCSASGSPRVYSCVNGALSAKGVWGKCNSPEVCVEGFGKGCTAPAITEDDIVVVNENGEEEEAEIEVTEEGNQVEVEIELSPEEEVVVEFNNDQGITGVEVEVDGEQIKVLAIEEVPGTATKTFKMPSEFYICPMAQSLPEVNPDCPSKITWDNLADPQHFFIDAAGQHVALNQPGGGAGENEPLDGFECTPGKFSPTGPGECISKWNSLAWKGTAYGSLWDWNCNGGTYDTEDYCGDFLVSYDGQYNFEPIDCDENKGCCKPLSTSEPKCIDATGDGILDQVNMSVNSCTGEEMNSIVECSKMSSPTGMPKICSVDNGNCHDDCEEGDIIYICSNVYNGNPKYKQHSCTEYSWGTKWSSGYPTVYELTCPEGAICYNPNNYACN